MNKICKKCKKKLPLESFAKQKLGKKGRTAQCKICKLDYTRNKDGLINQLYSGNIARIKKNNWEKVKYTKEELKSWLYNQPIFHKLYKNWKNNNYLSSLKPSIDRLDDYNSYSLDNIQIITWKENNDKYQLDRQKGINNKKNIAVDQYTINGQFIKRFHSIREASRETGANNSSITRVCNQKEIIRIDKGIKRTYLSKKAGGFIWKYSNNKKGQHNE